MANLDKNHTKIRALFCKTEKEYRQIILTSEDHDIKFTCAHIIDLQAFTVFAKFQDIS